MSKQLILASSSVQRSVLLTQIGIRFQVHAVPVDETPHLNEPPLVYVHRIAAEKSLACFQSIETDLPLLAADTCVVINGTILGKPEHKDDAVAMLQLLSGQTHQVLTALSLRTSTQHLQAVSSTAVCFRCLSEVEIENYWATGEPKGKAGAYAIQGLASTFIASINGSYSGVVGLPLFETAQLLAKQGIKVIR